MKPYRRILDSCKRWGGTPRRTVARFALRRTQSSTTIGCDLTNIVSYRTPQQGAEVRIASFSMPAGAVSPQWAACLEAPHYLVWMPLVSYQARYPSVGHRVAQPRRTLV